MHRPLRAPIAAAAAVALVALAGAGCGEKQEPPTTGPVVAETTSTTTTSTADGQSDQAAVDRAAMRFLGSPDPSVCDSGVTAAFLSRTYGDRRGCVAARTPSKLARTARFTELRIQAGTATLTARASGGPYRSGRTVELSLVRDGTGSWRVDAARPNAQAAP